MAFNILDILSVVIGFLVLSNIIQWIVFIRIFKVLNKDKEDAILHRNEIIKGINFIIENR